MHKLADAQRRGCAEERARRRLGMERLELDDADLAQIEALADGSGATALLELLSPDQRDAIRAHVIDERGYDEIARSLATSESVVRKRVSRGLAAVRRRMGDMSDDFVTRLGLQLQEAAERDVRRSAPVRALRGPRWVTPALAGADRARGASSPPWSPRPCWLRGDATPLPAQPRVVATLHVTDNPVQIVDAFGSIWIADHVAGRILRLDPATGAVQAHDPASGPATGSGSRRSATSSGRSVDELPLVQRIDPETNRVVARTPVRTPDGRPFRVGDVWAAGRQRLGGLRDRRAAPRPRHRPRASCVADAPRAVRWFELGDDTLWALGLGDTLHRLDPRTGARRGSIPSGLPGTEGIAAIEGALYATRGAELARLDPATGAAVWTRTFAGRLNGIDAVPGRRLGARHDRRAGRPAHLVRRRRRGASAARRRSRRSG